MSISRACKADGWTASFPLLPPRLFSRGSVTRYRYSGRWFSLRLRPLPCDGGAAPHGGGAFSGKDPTKVDRSAAYITRYLAKNIVAAGLAQRCTIQLAYAIGVSKPLSLYVDTHGTGTVGDDRIEQAIQSIEKLGGLTPRGIRTHLGLNKPIYKKTAAYGHFGRKAEGDFFPWEKTDLVDDLKAAIG